MPQEVNGEIGQRIPGDWWLIPWGLRLALGMALVWAAFLPAKTTVAGDVPRLLVAHGFGKEHPIQRGIDRLRDTLAGVLAVQAKMPGDDREAVRAMLAGEVDAVVVGPAALRDVVREATLLELIGLWRDREHWARALDGETGRQLGALAERAGRSGAPTLRVLGYWGGTRWHLLTRGEGVPTLEAMRTLRVRIPINPVRSKMWKAIGVRPVLLSRAEAVAALRAGTLEGLEDEAEAMLGERLFEVASHLTETGHAIATRLFVVSGPAWSRLPRGHQGAVLAAARTATTAAREAEAGGETEALATLRDRYGVTLHAFTGQEALMRGTQALRRRYADELGMMPLLGVIERSARP